ncbi:MAG: hypothetical protein BRC22_00815, partial [Parcubacteria group bacterium QH_9_35_7]
MSKDFLKKLKQFKLKKKEKEQGKDEIVEYMQDNPVRIEGSFRQYNWKRQPLAKFFHLFLTKKAMTASIVAAAMVLIGGGTSVAAQDAMPGDTLYPVKTNVNEEVVSALQLSSKAKAEYESKLADRRLEEVSQLAAEGRLSSEAATEAREEFEESANTTISSTQELKQEGNETAAANVNASFNSSIETHTSVLSGLGLKAKSKADGRAELGAEGNETSSQAQTEVDSKSKIELEGLDSFLSSVR